MNKVHFLMLSMMITTSCWTKACTDSKESPSIEEKDAQREQDMQNSTEQVHEDIKLNGQGLTAGILTLFYKQQASCDNPTTNDQSVRLSYRNRHRNENYYFSKTEDKTEIISSFSAEDERPLQSGEDLYNGQYSQTKKLTQSLNHQNPRRFSNAASIGTIRDRFTLCQFFHTYGIDDFKFRVTYQCTTEIDKDHQDWIEMIKEHAREKK